MIFKIADNYWWKEEPFLYLPRFYAFRAGRNNRIFIIGLIWGKGKWTLWIQKDLG